MQCSRVSSQAGKRGNQDSPWASDGATSLTKTRLWASDVVTSYTNNVGSGISSEKETITWESQRRKKNHKLRENTKCKGICLHRSPCEWA